MSVGLDIGSKTIKVVELAKDGANWRLKASGIVSYKGVPPEQSKEDKELAPLSAAIKKLYKDAKISSKNVAISLPETQVFTRTVKFPPLNDAEIASAVKWEADQYIPIPLSEAIVEHQIIERRENTTPAEVLVLLVATPKLTVEKYARVVEMSGLNLVVVETELMALVRSLAPIDQTVLLVDFGAKSTDIAVSKKGMLSFSRSIPTAGDAFTRAVSQTLGVEERQAEEYKKAYGLSGGQSQGKIKTALDPVFRMVADEMKKAIHFYQSDEKGDSPRSAVLSGGTAGMPEVASVLTKLLGIEVVVGNPFSKINVDPAAVRSLTGYAPLYSVAAGLALREE
ncbi:MAG: Type IV pilus assembly protein PilM [Candidatus Woesebacteria bacterium GW2011_GWA1_37_7]|uniref:Type IV pilus assembly protein PilM n=1 Tax=Candidatus Woesebacteria bacterium GW2011_GWA1_37_7 TaxID=1618545 RepID=A0A0G0K7D0_9BACT|nr:MAG: Type IV pilus assembly protein PilM [Candidatus Woesebacteria bacterium GW2011_GWA1_37_7]